MVRVSGSHQTDRGRFVAGTHQAATARSWAEGLYNPSLFWNQEASGIPSLSEFGDTEVSDAMLQIEISGHEREVLLRGLRFVRSAVMLETRDPSPDDTYQRSGQLDVIQMLSQRLESTDPLGIHA